MSIASGTAHRGSAIMIGGQGVRLLIQLLSIVILARLLDAEEFGLFAMVMSVVGVVSIFADAGLSLAAVQAKELDRAQRSNLFWLNFGIGVALALLVFFGADLIAAFFSEPGLADLARALSLVFLLNGLAAQFRAHINRELRFLSLAVADVLPQVIGFAVAVIGALLGWGFWALAAQQLVAASVGFVLIVVLARWWPALPSRDGDVRGMLRFGIDTTLVQSLNYLSVNIPAVVLGRWWGAVDVGNFNRAYSLFTLPMSQLAAPITRVALPLLSRIDDRERFGAVLARIQTTISFSLVGIFFLAAALAEPIIEVLLGPGWTDAVMIFRILAIGGVFQALGYVYYWMFISAGRTRLQLAYMAPLRVVMIALVIVAAPWGADAVALAVTVGLFLIWIVIALWAPRQMGLPGWKIVRSGLVGLAYYAVVAAAAGAADILLFVDLPYFLRLVLGLLVALVVMGAGMLIPGVRSGVLDVISTARRMLGGGRKRVGR